MTGKIEERKVERMKDSFRKEFTKIIIEEGEDKKSKKKRKELEL